jgi:ABC-type glutathione transport system ATPase component
MRTRLLPGMIFVTHDMAVAASLCDRIAVMKAGVVVETGPTRQVFENPQHPYTRLLIETAFALSRGDVGPAAPAALSAVDKAVVAAVAMPTPRNPPATALMSVEGLNLIFPGQGARQPFHALKDITLDLRQGEILGLVGESGSGKTTLGKTMLRLYEPTSGTLRLRAADITHTGERQLLPYRRQMQMVFQDPGGSFNPRRTIGSALAVALLTHGVCARAQIETRIVGLLERVGLLPAHAARFPHELSGGQLQRAAIARALSVAPALIVADEAVSKLDVSIRAGVLDLFKSIQAETDMSMVFITHDLEVARFLCHRVAVLYHGNLVEIGDTAEIFANPRHDYTKALLATLDRSLSGRALAGSVAVRALA